MPDNNYYSGAITITPPLNHRQIEECPTTQDARLDVTEQSVNAEDGVFVRRTAARILPPSGAWDARDLKDFIQDIITKYPGHEFAGHIQMQPDPGYGDPCPVRYVVRDRQVVEVKAVLVWPGEGDEEELLEILADAGDGGTYVVQCAGDFDRPQGVPVEDTDLPEQLLAWRDAAVKTHVAALTELRAKLETEYTVGDGIEPYRPATFTNIEAARNSRDLHRDEDGQIMRRLIGDWEVLPEDVTPDNLLPGYSDSKAAREVAD